MVVILGWWNNYKLISFGESICIIYYNEHMLFIIRKKVKIIQMVFKNKMNSLLGASFYICFPVLLTLFCIIRKHQSYKC